MRTRQWKKDEDQERPEEEKTAAALMSDTYHCPWRQHFKQWVLSHTSQDPYKYDMDLVLENIFMLKLGLERVKEYKWEIHIY